MDVEIEDDDQQVEVLISAIEHYSYCPRQCALIHVEGIYEENLYTMRGQLAHERVDAGEDDVREGIRAVRAIPLWSAQYGLRGKADLVEFREERPYPVEYKVGRRRGVHADLQLCAQALCLEEMLGQSVKHGAIFYHAQRRRHEVEFTDELRAATLRVVEGIREVLSAQKLPEAPNDERCPHCSLINSCLPWVVAEGARMRGLQGALFQVYDTQGGEAKEGNDA